MIKKSGIVADGVYVRKIYYDRRAALVVFSK